ncbi:hypothetical protein ACLMJK_002728 [Lecanora helva]
MSLVYVHRVKYDKKHKGYRVRESVPLCPSYVRHAPHSGILDALPGILQLCEERMAENGDELHSIGSTQDPDAYNVVVVKCIPGVVQNPKVSVALVTAPLLRIVRVWAAPEIEVEAGVEVEAGAKIEAEADLLTAA